MKYLALLRGVNVGGKNKVSMAELKICFEDLGFTDVSTYINSGNVLFSSTKSTDRLAKEIEAKLINSFKFDSEVIKTLILSEQQLKNVINYAPKEFGQHPEKYHSDIAFLIDVPSQGVAKEFGINPEVDAVWEGKGVVYYQRLSAKLTKSRISKVVGRPIYKSMTIRTWNTVNKLYDRMQAN